MNYEKQRNKLVDWTKSQLIGDQLKDDILVGEKPLDRFFTGFLFPIFESEEGLESDDDSENSDTAETKPVKKEKRYIPPSSAGFSFYVTGKKILLRIFHNAVYYEKLHNRDELNQKFAKQRWQKHSLTNNDGNEIEFTPSGKKQYVIFNGKAKIAALWRKHHEGYIVTISILNNQKLDDGAKDFHDKKNESTLFEVELKCIVEKGEVGAYPAKNMALLSDDEKEIELRYKDLRIYAVGHGTAVNWIQNKKDQMEIWSDFMPSVEVPQVTADTGGKKSKVLQFNFLSKVEQDTSVYTELERFIADYELWLEKQQQKATTEDDADQITANNIINRITLAKKRMKKGIHLLKQDELAQTSFAMANKAMLMQMIASDQAKGKTLANEQYRWRPFQLAFILMVLESTTNEDSNFRDTLDLIWFPTGGGKTEAYLGLMAFLFIYRRLRYPTSHGGTVAIMRYTLRLLTSQQFLRACKVISALELIRRTDSGKFGKDPFTIGLWVGSASSPNTFFQAKEYIEKKQYSKLILSNCPWCNAVFDRENYICKEDCFHFSCSNSSCAFGQQNNNILPYNVVDESLYKDPPSLLIATVDKFARLAWEKRSASFFGLNGNRPPELIIQDELHLISSALGSIVGLYEAGIDTLLIARGVRAKYIASTATIKNAAKQIKTLFAKDMLVFPPAGLRYDDSYFAKIVPLTEKPGRLYIGYLAPLLPRQNCLKPLAATLLAAPIKLFKDAEEYLDSWWTQIIYHGSLKGVSNSRTLYQSDINGYLKKITIENLREEIEELRPNFLNDHQIKTIEDYQRIKDPEVQEIVDQYLPVRNLNIKTLTSNQSAEDNAAIFKILAEERHQNNSIDVALATNMISVGLDVARLAVMIINGQPLTTAEYIQASSRVGRSDVPGIVFVNYYKTQARSLSHYENFRSYHDSFYRFVEPSSLTPFTYQARSRALHAALVIAMRHSEIGLLENDMAGSFDPDNGSIKKVIHLLKQRIDFAIDDKKKVTEVHHHIDSLVTAWHDEVQFSEKNRRNLVYFSNDKSSDNLIHNFDDKQGLWPTLQSMRNVENTALMKLLMGVKNHNEI